MSLVSRDGEQARPGRSTVLRAGDEVQAAGGEQPAAERVFAGRGSEVFRRHPVG
ncbi:hypothetical protein [Micromonospora wenchangensis]|uniref:hypothetical protein n=1 Tax=Micromonospora wenchangensis TaxID=1185415 RepID=UPI0037F43CA7